MPEPTTIALLAGTAISAGLSAAAGAGAFTPDTPEPPQLEDAAAAKQAAAKRNARRRGMQATVLASGKPDESNLSQPTVLGIR